MAKTMKNNVLKIILFLTAAAVICAAGVYIYNLAVKDINGEADKTKEYTLNITSSDFQYEVSQKLYQNKIILNDTLWTMWMDRHYPDFKYINGEYYLTDNMSYEELAQKLQNPDISHKTVSVCIPEVYSVFDIAETLDENGICTYEEFLEVCKSAKQYDYEFLKAVKYPDTAAYQLEGFLFPATYDIGENSNPYDVADKMLSAFADRITDKWTKYCSENNMSLYDLVNLASIVEKETLGNGVNKNIASVFFNRLGIGQKLQSDVTIFYGNELREHGFNDKIVTSYNTYKCPALPSGPVCNPGTENINAVINHNDTDYFYFFSYNDGADFYFTSSYNDFSKQWEKLGDK